MGTRETQRRAWREAVARAAEEWRAAVRRYEAADRFTRDTDSALMARLRLDAARLKPKPWTRPAKADLGDKWVYRTREALRRKRRAAQRRRR